MGKGEDNLDRTVCIAFDELKRKAYCRWRLYRGARTEPEAIQKVQHRSLARSATTIVEVHRVDTCESHSRISVQSVRTIYEHLLRCNLRGKNFFK